jgi:autotransporter-associated beta strand protein
VTFNDTLHGTPNVNLTIALSPATVTVSNAAANYVLSGPGFLTGPMTLLKANSGTVTLAETGGDNFSGGIIVDAGMLVLDNANANLTGNTTVNAGTLRLGNNDTNGALPAGSLIADGAVVFNRADNVTLTNNISGSGTLTQNNTNVVTLSGNSTFAGTATVAQGTLQVGSTNGIGMATSVTVNNGATFDVNGTALFGNGNANLVVTVAGAGVGGNGGLVNSDSSQARVLHTVTLAADSAFGGNGDWDIRNSTGSSATADAQLNGAYNLTKVGTNTVTLRGVTVDPALGNINVQAGGLTFTATATAPQNSLGSPAATATVYSNATLTLDTIGTVPGKNFVLANGGTLKSSGTNTLNNTVTVTGAANNTISVGTGGQFTITVPIVGGGGFSKNGSGTLFLPAANTYNGNTVVSGGALALYGGADGSIVSSVNINVTGGGTLDVSGRTDGTFTLVSGQTLNGGAGTNGPGVINGILVANVGAVVAPGTAPTNTGALAVSSNATLHGQTVMKLDPSGAANDQLSAYAVTYGGSLLVTNISGAPTNGQIFRLFVASNGNYAAGTFSSVTLPSAPGLTWTNNLAISGTIVAGVSSAAPPYITTVSLSGSSLTLSGTNGTPGRTFLILASTNVASPANQWLPVYTNTFAAGNFTISIPVDPAARANFYRIQVQ